MVKKSLVMILALWLVPDIVHAVVFINTSLEDGVHSPFGSPYGGSSVVQDPTAPDGSYSLKFTFPAGLYGGVAPDIVGKSFTETNELWVQYWFKYSTNWRWNTITNKQIYVQTGERSNADMNFTIMMHHYAAISSVATQHPADSTLNQTFRSYGWEVTKGVWHKVVFHAKMNTPGVRDGIFQMWIDDVLRTDQSDVLFRRTGQSTGFSGFQMTPVYGGGAENIPEEQYLWFDHVIVQTTPITGSPYPSRGAIEPVPPSGLKISN